MALFSGSGARRVGMFNAGLAENAINGGREILDGARADSLAAIAAGRAGSLGAIDTGQREGLAAIDRGEGLSLTALGNAYGAALPEYRAAIDRLNPWSTAGKSALEMYSDSIGLNGGSGNDRATAAFRASPGYQYQVDQALDQTMRKQSAIGALGSGNTLAAVSDRARNMADAEFGSWQDRLNGQSTQGFQAAGAQAGMQQGLAGLIAQQGRDESGILTGNATNRANINTTAGNARAGIFTNAANNESNTFQNIAGLGVNNLWNGIGSITNSLSNAQKQAQDNVNSGFSFGINALGSLVKLGTGLSGMGGGGLTAGSGGLY